LGGGLGTDIGKRVSRPIREEEIVLSEGWAKRFAEEWIQAWNSHDLEQILFHYVEDFEMTTPFIAKSMNEPSGTIRGKRNVGAYWAKALAQVPDFQFELLDVLLGVGSIIIYYRGAFGELAAEVLFFDECKKVVRAVAHYHEI
jgi:hypothetical protein